MSEMETDRPVSEVRRYGLLVIVEETTPRRAFEAVAGPLLGVEGPAKAVYVGAPRQGLPLAAAEFSTEELALGCDMPDGEGGALRISVRLLPAD